MAAQRARAVQVKSCWERQQEEKTISRGWFRSIDLWVMGPARFRCATLLPLAPQLGPPTARPDAPWHCQRSCLLPFVYPVPSSCPGRKIVSLESSPPLGLVLAGTERLHLLPSSWYRAVVWI